MDIWRQFGSAYSWALFRPSGANLAHLLQLASEGTLVIPPIKVFKMKDAIQAFAHKGEKVVLSSDFS
jgi:hypothetical protein